MIKFEIPCDFSGNKKKIVKFFLDEINQIKDVK